MTGLGLIKPLRSQLGMSLPSWKKSASERRRDQSNNWRHSFTHVSVGSHCSPFSWQACPSRRTRSTVPTRSCTGWGRERVQSWVSATLPHLSEGQTFTSKTGKKRRSTPAQVILFLSFWQPNTPNVRFYVVMCSDWIYCLTCEKINIEGKEFSDKELFQ